MKPTKIQTIKKPNGKKTHFIYIPAEIVERAYLHKGENITWNLNEQKEIILKKQKVNP